MMKTKIAAVLITTLLAAAGVYYYNSYAADGCVKKARALNSSLTERTCEVIFPDWATQQQHCQMAHDPRGPLFDNPDDAFDCLQTPREEEEQSAADKKAQKEHQQKEQAEWERFLEEQKKSK
jgi:hypothetical protein